MLGMRVTRARIPEQGTRQAAGTRRRETSVQAARAGGRTGMYPPMRERRNGVGRLVWWTVWVLLIVYVLNHPTQAAAGSRALAGIEDAGEAIAVFIVQAGGGR